MATAHHWMEIRVSGQSAKKTRTGTRAQPAPAIRVATSQSMTQQASWSRTRGTMPHTPVERGVVGVEPREQEATREQMARVPLGQELPRQGSVDRAGEHEVDRPG